jgi:hypothetical protein
VLVWELIAYILNLSVLILWIRVAGYDWTEDLADWMAR